MPSTTLSPVSVRRAALQADLLAAYDDLIPRAAWTREQIRGHQTERLRILLRHAADNSPFHAERLAGLDLDAVTADDLSALPVMSKSDLMDRFDDVVTDPRVTLERAEAALAEVVDEPAMLDFTLVLTSGGSSGPRGVFLLDRPASRQFFGTLTRGLVERLRAAGTPPGGFRMAMVAAGSPVHATGTASWLTTDSPLPFFAVGVPVTQPLEDIVTRLNAIDPMALYGYPTMLARLAAEQQAGRLRIAPRVVTCTSETLTAESRTAIRAGFGVPVADTFGSTEGLVGTSPPDDDVIVFAEDGCIVELVDGADRPVPPGTPSAAVLVTVLENRLQPLIRYRLTDSFVQHPPADGHGHLRARVQGRADEVLRYGEVLVHPFVVRSALAHAPDVADYRVRQIPRGIVVSALAPTGTDVGGLRARLTAGLAAAGLPDPDVTVDVVSELPRDPDSGKLRRFVALT